MFVHSVYFWLKHSLEQPDREAFRRALEGLADIACVRQLYAGQPPEARRDVVEGSFTFALTVVFDDVEAHDEYQQDPAHLRFVEQYHGYWEKLIVYDAV